MSQPSDENKKPWTPPPFKGMGAPKSVPQTDAKNLLTGSDLIGGSGGFKPASVGQRLRNLKKEEMAFLLAGLPLLFLAPLLEHLVMTPKKGQKGGMQSLQQNEFNFPGNGDPVERGILNMAAGGVLGQKPSVTPLDAPDPLKFIVTGDMADQSASQTITPEPVKKEEKKSSDWESALAAAAKPAVSQVSRSAGLPRPAGKLSSSLSGLASLNAGATKAAGSGANVPTTPGGGGGRGGFLASRTQSMPAIKGMNERSNSAGGAPASLLNRSPEGFKMPGGGAAVSGMDYLTPSGGKGGLSINAGGQPASGEDTKMPGATAAKDAKTMTNAGESLTQQMMKERAMKQIALEYDKKRYNQIERKKMLEQIAAQTASQAALKAEEKLLEALTKGGEGQGQGGGGGGGDQGGGGDPLAATQNATANQSGPALGNLNNAGTVASSRAAYARQLGEIAADTNRTQAERDAAMAELNRLNEAANQPPEQKSDAGGGT